MEIANYYYMPTFNLGNSTDILVTPYSAIIIDSSSLLTQGIETVLQQALENKIRLYEPISAYYELKNVANKRPEMAEACNRALYALNYIYSVNHNVIQVGGGQFLDADILAQTIPALAVTDVVCISQDKDLIATLKQLPKFISRCVKTYHHRLSVATIVDGILVRA